MNSMPPLPAVEAQSCYWNEWNKCRESELGNVSLDQAALIEHWLKGRSGLKILDVGCGTGWLCDRLVKFGEVTGTDLADRVIARAQARVPAARFFAGDFMELEFGQTFDVVTCLEVLSHVADQRAFIVKVAQLLRPGGELLLATQNRFVLQRSDVLPPGEGQIRHWVDRRELRRLLKAQFHVAEMTTRTPEGHCGILRAVNSVKLNRLSAALVGEERVRRLKEYLGFGWTIMIRANRLS
jgi:2-polyprenyl-3-methyl-5-hydroxy-6-metoxy-1,4-benzoquinol methylase